MVVRMLRSTRNAVDRFGMLLGEACKVRNFVGNVVDEAWLQGFVVCSGNVGITL